MTLARAAWILATHTNDEVRDSAEAVTLAERASELTGHKHPAVEDTLAVAYAAAGDYDRAVATAENALILLSGPGHDKAVHEIQRHLKLFKNRTPLRESRERQNPSSRDAGDG